MKIGILGGSFDPPHLGHLLVAQQSIENCGLNRVLFVPCYSRNLRNSLIANPKDRFLMTKFLENEFFYCSDIEIKRKGTSFAIDTILELKKKNSKDEFFWIVGSDLVSELSLWKDYKKLICEIKFIVFPRLGVNIDSNLVNKERMILLDNVVATNISSTIVRKRIKEGLSIKWMVTNKVKEYILEKKLYKV